MTESNGNSSGFKTVQQDLSARTIFCSPDTGGDNNHVYTAKEIAALLGVSDSTIRVRWRTQLEQVYGVGSLQDSLGNYTYDAFLEFQKLQTAIASSVPKRNNAGEIVYANNVPVMISNQYRIGFPKYKSQLEKSRVIKPTPVEVEVLEPESKVLAVVVEENDDSLAVMDAIAYQYGDILNRFRTAGRVLGQKAKAELNKGFADGFSETPDVATDSLENFDTE